MDVGYGGHELLAGGLAIVVAIMLCISTFFFGIHMIFDFLLIGFCGIYIFFTFFDWIFPFCNMSLRVDIGIFRMWILTFMEFEVGIHIIMISLVSIMRKVV